MDNKLLVKRYELNKNLNKCYVIDKIKEFLKKYEKEFTSVESKEAIIRIKQFLNSKEEEQRELELEKNKIKNQITSTCKHEILIKNYDQAICLICGHWDFINEIDYNHFFFEDLMYPEESHIYEIIYKIAVNNEDVFEVFEDYVDDVKLNKAKVYYRRMS